MKEWWLQLNNREQQLVSGLGAVVVIFVLYSFIWKPLNSNIEQGIKKLERQQSLLSWVASETSRYQANKGNRRPTSSVSVSSIINRTARAQGITIARVQPQNSDVQVWIDNTSFNALLTWLQQLSVNEGIQVKNIDLTGVEQSGEVRVKRLQLGR